MKEDLLKKEQENTKKRIKKGDYVVSFYLNNQKVINKNIKKPCHLCGFCPYGSLVEEFPLRKKRNKKISCGLFGHDCPAFYHAESIGSENDP